MKEKIQRSSRVHHVSYQLELRHNAEGSHVSVSSHLRIVASSHLISTSCQIGGKSRGYETGRKKKKKKSRNKKRWKAKTKSGTPCRRQPIKVQNASKSRVEAGKLKTFALKKGHPRNSGEVKMPRKEKGRIVIMRSQRPRSE